MPSRKCAQVLVSATVARRPASPPLRVAREVKIARALWGERAGRFAWPLYRDSAREQKQGKGQSQESMTTLQMTRRMRLVVFSFAAIMLYIAALAMGTGAVPTNGAFTPTVWVYLPYIRKDPTPAVRVLPNHTHYVNTSGRLVIRRSLQWWHRSLRYGQGVG